VVCDAGRASTSTLQRRLRIGYGRAARLIDLRKKRHCRPPEGTKPREVLKNRNWMRNSTNPRRSKISFHQYARISVRVGFCAQLLISMR